MVKVGNVEVMTEEELKLPSVANIVAMIEAGHEKPAQSVPASVETVPPVQVHVVAAEAPAVVAEMPVKATKATAPAAVDSAAPGKLCVRDLSDERGLSCHVTSGAWFAEFS